MARVHSRQASRESNASERSTSSQSLRRFPFTWPAKGLRRDTAVGSLKIGNPTLIASTNEELTPEWSQAQRRRGEEGVASAKEWGGRWSFASGNAPHEHGNSSPTSPFPHSPSLDILRIDPASPAYSTYSPYLEGTRSRSGASLHSPTTFPSSPLSSNFTYPLISVESPLGIFDFEHGGIDIDFRDALGLDRERSSAPGEAAAERHFSSTTVEVLENQEVAVPTEKEELQSPKFRIKRKAPPTLLPQSDTESLLAVPALLDEYYYPSTSSCSTRSISPSRTFEFPLPPNSPPTLSPPSSNSSSTSSSLASQSEEELDVLHIRLGPNDGSLRDEAMEALAKPIGLTFHPGVTSTGSSRSSQWWAAREIW